MELKVCEQHKYPCFLKTGTKEGPSKGKSYYICGRGAGKQCSFVEPVDIPVSHCLVHPGSLVELQALASKVSSSGETRQYYRCQAARREGKEGWCGHTFGKIKQDPSARRPLASLNGTQSHQYQSKEKPNPFAVSDKASTETDQIQQRLERGECIESTTVTGTFQGLEGKTVGEQSSGYDNRFGKEKAGADEESIVRSEEMIPKNNRVAEARKPRDEAGGKVTPGEVERLQSLLEKQHLTKDAESGTRRNEMGVQMGVIKDGKSEGRSDRPSVLAVGPTAGMKSGNREAVDLRSENGSQQTAHGGYHGHMKTTPQVTQGHITSTTSGHQSGMGASQPGARFVVPVGTSNSSVHQPSFHQYQQGTLPGVTKSVSQHTDTLWRSHQLLSQQLLQHRQTMKSVPLSLLPDKGQRLQMKIKELEASLSSIERELSTSKAVRQPATTQLTQMTIRDHLMKAMQSTTHPDLMAYQYAANPQMQTLYGGRMTTARLREVGSVTNDAIKKIHESLEGCPTQDEMTSDPKGLKVSLMQHQCQGLTWLLWRERQHPCGGILADDMGLGKTLTMIALVMKQKEVKAAAEEEEEEATDDSETAEDGDIPKAEDEAKAKDETSVSKDFIKSNTTLIICPASLMDHWALEVERRCNRGKLTVHKYHGPNRTKRAKDLIKYDLVITTYQIISRELEELIKDEKGDEATTDIKVLKLSDQPIPLQIGWERIILDEAHNIKNPKSKSAMAICKLRARARWAITGTPIQNNLLDMYALLRFLRFSPFDELKVWKKQVDNQKRSGNKWLATLMKALLLRRTKDQMNSQGKPLVNLPDKNIKTHQIKLSSQEQKVYDKLFHISRGKVQDYINYQEDKRDGYVLESSSGRSANAFATHGQASAIEKTHAGGTGGAAEETTAAPSGKMSGTQVLTILLRLRQCCTHLSLLKEIPEDEELKEDGIELSLIGQMKDLGLSDGKLDHKEEAADGSKEEIGSQQNTSSKVKVVLDAIREMQTEDSTEGGRSKCVVVSQWTQMLEVMDIHLQKANIETLKISGTVSQKKRSEAVEDFNNNRRGPQVMLLSLKAGGVGLNLIGGNHLFMMDMHWNPALEDQACDRIYRVGQTKNVKIHKFVCKETIEERILMLQKRKTQLAKDVLSGSKERRGNKLTIDDLKLLFKLR